MQIDNSAANAFRVCPYLYFEQYEAEGTGLEHQPYPDEGVTPLAFGARGHELMEIHYKEMAGMDVPFYPESENAALEMEVQLVMGAYKTHYPVEVFKILDVERTIEVPLPSGRHTYIFKTDLLIQYPDKEVVDIMDHKFQTRTSKSNLPQKWAAKDQASLYLWAAEQYYQRPVGNFYVNAITRPSEKGRIGPTFPDRQKLERTPEQLAIAVRNIEYIADQIEDMRVRFKGVEWPSNKENCYTWGQCEMYLPHTYGWSPEIREQRYQPKTPYLDKAAFRILG